MIRQTLITILLLCFLIPSCSRVARQPEPAEGVYSARGRLDLGIQHYSEILDACRLYIYWADALKIVNYDLNFVQ